MITFLISYKNDIKNIEYDSNKTLLSLKKYIINELELESKYIDLDFKNESPIRGMGKFNLEKGIILRTFDNYKLERWNLENKEIQCEIIEVDDYEPKPIAACTSEAEANNIVEQLHNEGVGSFRVSGYPAIPLNPNGIDLANAIRAKWDEY